MKFLGYKINGYLVILGFILVFMLLSATGCGCLKCGLKEGWKNKNKKKKMKKPKKGKKKKKGWTGK